MESDKFSSLTTFIAVEKRKGIPDDVQNID
jgi:hypothetical protein